ncbi:MAG: hypothetical protein Q9166_004294 [cf. Caloplaca sp. 2 TL-2023]
MVSMYHRRMRTYLCYREELRLHIRARHPQRFQCNIKDCGTTFDFRTPFAKHVSKQYQQLIQDGAFTTASASRSPPPRQRRARKVPEGFILVDITPALDPRPNEGDIGAEVFEESPQSPEGSPDTLFLGEKDTPSPRDSTPTDAQCLTEGYRQSMKRKASLPGDDYSIDRIIRARFCEHKPDYEVKQSRKYPGQQQGLLWLSEKSKENFDRSYEILLGRWGGLRPEHSGTCVLCPEAWRVKTPPSLVEIADPGQFPSREAEQMLFSYSDFSTSFVRVAAWFRSGRRLRGVELDNFLGVKRFRRMEASRLCHQEHCIVRTILEPLDRSLDRRRYALWVHNARRAGHDIHRSGISSMSPPGTSTNVV